jgi:hypothetical protein
MPTAFVGEGQLGVPTTRAVEGKDAQNFGDKCLVRYE